MLMQEIGVRTVQPMDIMVHYVLPTFKSPGALNLPESTLLALLAFPLASGLLSEGLEEASKASQPAVLDAGGASEADAASDTSDLPPPQVSRPIEMAARGQGSPVNEGKGWLLAQLRQAAVLATNRGAVRVSSAAAEYLAAARAQPLPSAAAAPRPPADLSDDPAAPDRAALVAPGVYLPPQLSSGDSLSRLQTFLPDVLWTVVAPAYASAGGVHAQQWSRLLLHLGVQVRVRG